MSKEKQIKKMSQDLSECIDYDEWAAREYGETYVDYDSTAFNMVARGWSKQSEGEWKWISDDDCICSACGKVFYTADNADAGLWNFCPNCGARMKGA